MQALEAMRNTLLAGTRDKFLACFDANEAEAKTLLGGLWGMTSSRIEFEEALVKEYGEEAIEKEGRMTAILQRTCRNCASLVPAYILKNSQARRERGCFFVSAHQHHY